MSDNKKIDELVSEIDNFFKNGGSHMNVSCNSDNDITKTIRISYNECCEGQDACGIPTEFFDEEDV